MVFESSEYEDWELAYARRFTQHYRFTHSPLLLAAAANPGDLFTGIEQEGFLSEQIAVMDGFGEAQRTIEQHALPAVIAESASGRACDWLRFLHYALVGANLRGAAESLAEPEILRALVRQGKLTLARSIAEQLPRASWRARALAVITGALDPGHRDYDGLLQATSNELKLAPWPVDQAAAEEWQGAIEAVAEELPLQLEGSWLEWLGRLDDFPELRSAAQEAVVGTWLAAGEPNPWRIAQVVELYGDARPFIRQLLRLCDKYVTAMGLERALEALSELRTELGSELYWQAVVTSLAAATASVPKKAVARWQELTAAEQVPWTPALIEHGAALWYHLDEPQLRDLEHSLDDPESRCALRVCRFEGQPVLADWPDVDAAIGAIQAGEAQLHWALRAMLAGAACASHVLQRPLAKITRHLARSRYQAPPRDLACFLDLVAKVTPKELQRQLENLLWSPRGDENLLRTVVNLADTRLLQVQLLARVESYAAHVAGSGADGFVLRRELLTELTARLSVKDCDLTWLQRAIPRCATSELDGLKSRVAVALTGARHPELARRIIEGDETTAGVESYRVRLLTYLRMGGDQAILNQLLAPASLYRAVADTRAVEDEFDALSALCLEPVHPGEVAEGCLAGMHDGSRRLLAHVDLAWHALLYEQRSQPAVTRDPSAALLPLRSALQAMPSLELGAALVPEQVRLGAYQGLRETIGDLKESFSRLARRGSLTWEVRYAALVALLATMVRVLSGEVTAASWHRRRATANLLTWLLALPADDTDEERQELREHWHQVLPFVVAAAERLPKDLWWFWRHPILAWIGITPGSVLLDVVGRKRWQRLLTWVDQRWQVSGFQRLLLGSQYRVGEEQITQCWTWLKPNQLRIIIACLQGPVACRRQAQQLVAVGTGQPDLVAALSTVLAPTAPRLAIGLLGMLPAGKRNCLVELLLRLGWIDPSFLDDLVPLISDEVAGKRVQAICGRGDRQREALLDLVAADQADPLDPIWSDLRRQLRGQQLETREALLTAIAREVVPALANGGKEGGERALRWWLQVFLGPGSGAEQPGWQQQRNVVREAIRRSQQLGPNQSSGSTAQGSRSQLEVTDRKQVPHRPAFFS